MKYPYADTAIVLDRYLPPPNHSPEPWVLSNRDEVRRIEPVVLK